MNYVPGSLINVENNNLQTIINSDYAKQKLIVCDFYADWCGPCKMIAPEFERLGRVYSQTCVFVKCNVDRNQIDAQSRGVRSMPT